MFQMKYTTVDETSPIINSSQLNNTGRRNTPLPVFNIKERGKRGASITIRNIFERVRSGNEHCGNCGGFKTAF